MSEDWKEDYIEGHSYTMLLKAGLLCFLKMEIPSFLMCFYFIGRKFFKENAI